MKKIIWIPLFCLLFLTACSMKSPYEQDIFAMDTFINLKVWDNEEAMSAVAAQINAYDASLSVTRDDSEVFKLNQDGRAELSEKTAQLLRQAIYFSEKTEGAFDPTVYPLVKAWGFSSGQNSVPDEAALTPLLNYVGTENISLSGRSVTLSEGTQLDFGAIAKGYAAERCKELLEEKGVETAILSLGGNVQTIGSKPDGTEWVIGIADPQEPSSAIAQLRFTGSLALVTSGSYQRYFEEDGIRYHHILDPATGRPVENGLASVTVIADSGTMADAYSTALFVMGMEQAVQFWRQEQNFEAIFILEDSRIFATQGAAAILRGCEFTEIK